MRSPWHSEKLTELPAATAAAITTRVSTKARKARETYDQKVQRLARDIENIHGREGGVKEEDLLTLGWSAPALTEMLPDAMHIVRGRAERELH